MADAFQHDVFLSHSAKDKAVVRPLAERLLVAVRKHLKVGFDETEIRNPNPEIRNKSESPNEGKPKRTAQHPAAHLLVYPIGEFELVSDFGFRDSNLQFGLPGLSAHTFGSDWAQSLRVSQPSTLSPQPASAPLNQERRARQLAL